MPTQNDAKMDVAYYRLSHHRRRCRQYQEITKNCAPWNEARSEWAKKRPISVCVVVFQRLRLFEFHQKITRKKKKREKEYWTSVLKSRIHYTHTNTRSQRDPRLCLIYTHARNTHRPILVDYYYFFFLSFIRTKPMRTFVKFSMLPFDWSSG